VRGVLAAGQPASLNKKKRHSKIVVRASNFSSARVLKSRKTKRGALEKAMSGRTAKSTRKIAVQAARWAKSGAELMNLDILQSRWREFGAEGEGNTVSPAIFGA